MGHRISSSEFAKDFRAIISQAFNEPNRETFFDIKRLAFKSESEAFLFVQPGGLLNRKLAIKRLDYLADDWQIEIEVLGGMSSSISLPIQMTDVAGLADELNTKHVVRTTQYLERVRSHLDVTFTFTSNCENPCFL